MKKVVPKTAKSLEKHSGACCVNLDGFISTKKLSDADLGFLHSHTEIMPNPGQEHVLVDLEDWEIARAYFKDQLEVLKTAHQREAVIRGFADVINRNSLENHSNTPDFVLAEYLYDCLIAFGTTSRAREKWYGKTLSIGASAQEPI